MLTKEQQRAVQHVYGPMMVVAGPGSGKTTVLTQRVKELLKYTRPERILVITFARKAAEEMKLRFAGLTDVKTAQLVNFGTFHAVFFHYLKKWGVLHHDVQVLEEAQQKELWLELGWDMEDVPAFLVCRRDEALRYEREKYRRNLVDFDDMIQLMLAEMDRHNMAQDFDFILVDEFQDINPQQYEILRKMVRTDDANLFVVGDEDQAIYAFRGSDPGIFLRFPVDFPDCLRVDLSMNFRCQGRIAEASKQLVSHNRKRFEKNICAYHPDGEMIRLRSVFDEKQEARYIRDQVLQQHKEGFAYTKMAVLCRTNAQLRRISAALQEGGVPYVCTESWEIGDKPEELLIRQDLELFWRLSRNRTDRTALRGVLRTLPKLQNAGNWRRLPMESPLLEGMLKQQVMDPQARRELEELEIRLERGAKMEKRKAFWYYLWQTDYLSYAYEKGKRRGISRLGVWRQIRQMMMEMKGSDAGVLLATMHGVKGLEFDWVWIAGMNEGQMPRKEALEAGELEEERRLLYVAMTRAKRRLTLSYHDGLGVQPSRFLKEIKSLHFVF